jgi:hypothetical protein
MLSGQYDSSHEKQEASGNSELADQGWKSTLLLLSSI